MGGGMKAVQVNPRKPWHCAFPRSTTAPGQLSIDDGCQIIMHRDRRDVLRKPILQRLAAKARTDQHTPAPDMEGRLQVIGLVTDEWRLGGDRPVARKRLAQHTA